MMELGTFSTLYGILAVCFVSPPPAFVNLGLTVQVSETFRSCCKRYPQPIENMLIILRRIYFPMLLAKRAKNSFTITYDERPPQYVHTRLSLPVWFEAHKVCWHLALMRRWGEISASILKLEDHAHTW
jgi:hypothetical protein